jgi:molybdopterin-guanine dinucleotide biosynthesis protein A
MSACAVSGEAVSIAILAGGRGARMGADKGLVKLGGVTLVERIYQKISRYSDDIMISANRNFHEYESILPTARLIKDEHEGFNGPLAGMYSCLRASRYDHLITIPCDFMNIPDNLIESMALKLHQKEMSYARINGVNFFPLCNLHKQYCQALEGALIEGKYSVRKWLESNGAGVDDFTIDEQLLMNMNTPGDISRAEEILLSKYSVGAML